MTSGPTNLMTDLIINEMINQTKDIRGTKRVKKFAYLPVNTQDAGRVWLSHYEMIYLATIFWPGIKGWGYLGKFKNYMEIVDEVETPGTRRD